MGELNAEKAKVKVEIALKEAEQFKVKSQKEEIQNLKKADNITTTQVEDLEKRLKKEMEDKKDLEDKLGKEKKISAGLDNSIKHHQTRHADCQRELATCKKVEKASGTLVSCEKEVAQEKENTDLCYARLKEAKKDLLKAKEELAKRGSK